MNLLPFYARADRARSMVCSSADGTVLGLQQSGERGSRHRTARGHRTNLVRSLRLESGQTSDCKRDDIGGEGEFEIPVQIREGSWEALVPTTVGSWAQAGLGIALTAYLAKAAQTLAQNDFKDVTTQDIFQRALQGIQWFARIR